MAWFTLNENILTLFENGTFESSSSGWSSYYTPTFMSLVRSSTHAATGSFSGKLFGTPEQINLPDPDFFPFSYTHSALLMSFQIWATAGRRYVISGKFGHLDWPADDPESINFGRLGFVPAVTGDNLIAVEFLGSKFDPGSFIPVGSTFTAPSTGVRTIYVVCLYNSDGSYHPAKNGSTYIDDFKIEEQVQGMTTSHSVTHISEHQAGDGAIDVSVSGGSGSYSYLWDDGPTTEDRSGLGPGLYTVTITDDVTGEEKVIQDIEVLEPAPTEIFAVVDTTDAFCNGSSTGAINITSVTGGDGGPFTFAWGDGPTTQNRANIPAGTYSVTITDGSNNTLVINDIVVGEPTVIAIVVTVEGQNINVAVSGGTPPYTYAWADGPTTKNRTNLDPGDYTLTVTDNNGCTEEVTVTVAQFRFFFTRNPVVLELAADSHETKDNLSFLCEVHIEENYNTGVFSKVATLENPADADGATVFDVQGILDGFEGLKRYLPAFNQSVITQASTIFKRFYLAHTEKYGTPPVPSTFSEEVVNYMVLGGLSYEEYASDYFFTNYLDEVKPFFTWQLPQKYAFNDQPEFLFFMVPQFTVSELNVKVDLHLVDGQVINLNAFTQSDVNRYEVYCIPAGFQQLLLDQQAAYDLVDKWQVYVEDQNGTRISQVRTYYMIHDYYPHRRFFLFRNSLGGMDTFVATGMAELKMKTKVEKIDKLLPHDYNISDGQVQVTKKTADMEMDLTSGYLWQRAELERAQDFLKSEDVFEMINSRYVPVEIEGGGVVTTDEAGPVSIKFTAIPPRVENFTPFLGNNVDGGAQPVDPAEYLLVNSTFLRINRG